MVLLHIVVPDEWSLLAARPGYVGKGGSMNAVYSGESGTISLHAVGYKHERPRKQWIFVHCLHLGLPWWFGW